MFYTLHKRHAVYYQKNVGCLRCVILSIILNRWWKWHTKEQRTLTSCLSSISSLAILRNLAKWRRLVCIFSSLLISLWSAPWLVLERGQINMSDFFPIFAIQLKSARTWAVNTTMHCTLVTWKKESRSWRVLVKVSLSSWNIKTSMERDFWCWYRSWDKTAKFNQNNYWQWWFFFVILFRLIGILDSSYTWPSRGMPGDQGYLWSWPRGSK